MYKLVWTDFFVTLLVIIAVQTPRRWWSVFSWKMMHIFPLIVKMCFCNLDLAFISVYFPHVCPPPVIKTDFLLITSIQYQADRRWELREISLLGFLVDPCQIPQTNVIRFVWQIVRRISHEILRMKKWKVCFLVRLTSVSFSSGYLLITLV